MTELPQGHGQKVLTHPPSGQKRFAGSLLTWREEPSEEKPLEALTKEAPQSAICWLAPGDVCVTDPMAPFCILDPFPSSQGPDSSNPAGRIWYETSV